MVFHTQSWRSLLVLLACCAALVNVVPVFAHANLVRSTPSLGATLAEPPGELILEFAEDLDPSFTRVQLFNGANRLVDAGPGTIDPATPRVLRLKLNTRLVNDAYTALWRARSAIDGHVVEGSLPFGVGVAAPAGGLIPEPGTPDPATIPPPPLESTVRWLNLLVAAIALGGLPFALFVWRPVLRQSARADRQPAPGEQWALVDQTITRFIRQLLVGGCIAWLITTLLLLIVQAANAADVPLIQAFGAPLVQLLSGPTGWLIMVRVLLIIATAIVGWRLREAGHGAPRDWWVALALGAAILLTLSLNSHGAAIGDSIAILLDWVHRTAMVAWLGGLIPLAAALRFSQRNPEQELPVAQLIPQFTKMAVDAVVVLAISGTYAAYVHIERLDLMAATTYGRALGVKLVLFGVLLLFGAINLFVLTPKLAKQQATTTVASVVRALRRTVLVELLLGGIVLLAAGMMTSIAPSRIAWEEHERQGIAQSITVDDVELTLRVAPAWIGDNEFAVDVADRRPGAQEAETKVLLRFEMQDMNMGELQAEMTPIGTQRYGTRGSFVSMGGRWHVEVILRKAGFNDIRHTFTVDVVRSAQ